MLHSNDGLDIILKQKNTITELAVYFQKGLHSGINIFTEADLQIYDSILTKRLTEAGILTTSLIILIILCFSFYYLIHIILKQKTLEEMKSDFTNNITYELKTPIAVAYAANNAMLNYRFND